jgi:hypothetical protein
MTEKRIIEFGEEETHYFIDVVACALMKKEFAETRKELSELNFRFNAIEADSISAKYQGTYQSTMDTLEKLEENNWTWE